MINTVTKSTITPPVLELKPFRKGDPVKIVQKFRATKLYTEKFLAALEEGLRTSQINNS